jgi:nucleotide-binding universal stress UspA family protein
VPSTGSELDRTAAEMAIRAADPSSAHLAFLHVRMDVKQVRVMLAGSGMTLGTGLVGLEEEAEAAQRRARERFETLCTGLGLHVTNTPRPGISASWSIVTGEESACLAQHARVADAIALSRGDEGDMVVGDLLARALMQSGRPVLIAPSAPSAPITGLQKTIAIAWKDRPEAARAVTAAMPFIVRAERVVILSVSENAGGDDQSSHELRNALRWHNPNVSVQRLVRDERPAARILLDGAAGPGIAAGLLVMGGYGHTRLREAVFGGFTRHVLAGAGIPVLLTH